MSTSREEILQAALQLSESDRRVIVDRLMESLPDDIPGLSVDDPEFTEELRRRSGDWEGAVSWKQLRDELHRGQ